ncbi:glutathione synthase [Annulohypoxylon maeteangense]|uniref:glutathione synthase n=1 Tax=Annulohypoxylon maeteangense TaxID=1927788 RepID=UPI0020081335|nr:glutathione synthase [Annulohypoxylon maeteangense]KAI0880523.1 glutathione synthase [Annulohypoxylon maeteangense]
MQEQVDEEHLENILSELEDYQITHASLLKIPRASDDCESTVAIARPIGVSILPTTFPRHLFNHALNIQTLFNQLYMKISEDDAWLQNTIQKLGEADTFVAKLWSIWERVRNEGEVQPLRCGIFRSDYMIHHDSSRTSGREATTKDYINQFLMDSELKQVEFNTYSCAGGAHANTVANMHRYLASKCIHKVSHLPINHAVRSMVEALECAHREYGSPVDKSRGTAILMTVQPNNVNICDERPVEYALSECEPPIVLYRVEFSDEIVRKCSLGPSRELLFRPNFENEAVEISVVYQRAGYDPHEYDQQGIHARYMLERSRAIKCPTILSHLAGLKKVQQELTSPGMTERFIAPDIASVLRRTFVPQYPFDVSQEGIQAKEIALDKHKAENHVLKPSLEGGGNNIYGKDISDFLKTVPEKEWSKYVLMERIRPPLTHGVLISPVDTHKGPVICELGILGTCLWRGDGQGGEKVRVIHNNTAGWTFKTKPEDVQEMSVVKGYGCFDCPSLL